MTKKPSHAPHTTRMQSASHPHLN